MNSKILRAIWTVAILVFLASLFFIMTISYSYFTLFQKNLLRNETELAAQGVAISGKAFFDELNTSNYRITWIDHDGNVLYDNEVDSEKLGNHLEREEVKLAIKNGYGESDRYSNTLAHRQFYSAKKLPDGSILRLSIVQAAVWTLVLGFAQPIVIVIFIALFLSFVLASRLAKNITKPINEIDLENPESYYGKKDYKEIEPLLRHISAQKIQLKRDQEQIEQTALIRQEFTANVSHELKSPLHAISGYAELLENGLVRAEDIRPFARKIREESSRLTSLVEDIINLTKLDSGEDNRTLESCDLYRIAENAIDSLQSTASELDVNLELSGTKAPMVAYPELLHSIVYNLCDNAIKYNHKGGSVFVKVSQDKDRTTLSVKDTGIGIPKESQERVFERFYRVDKSRSKEVGGTGLGLSITKHAVLVHRGSFKVVSEVGKGSEFIIILPTQPT
ncbi:MAG: hypothetical protein K6G51_02355 [Sphaerochaetaceae bacterium]|nr:hypothetical protein [Sphaerochaetaceae bacterium]